MIFDTPLFRLTVGVILTIIACSWPASADMLQPADAAALMQRSHEAGMVDDSQARTSFRLISANGKVRVQEALTITRRNAEDGATSRLARFLIPADVKNTAVLTVENPGRDDDIWLYLPALGKVRRLQGNNTREAYMGTDLSYADVLGHAPEEWLHTVLSHEAIDGVECWVVESLPRDAGVAKESGYGKRVSWISREHDILIREVLYDLSGNPVKRIAQSNIEQVSANPARWHPMAVDVENLRTHHRTEIRFSDFKANIGLDAALFSPRALERR